MQKPTRRQFLGAAVLALAFDPIATLAQTAPQLDTDPKALALAKQLLQTDSNGSLPADGLYLIFPLAGSCPMSASTIIPQTRRLVKAVDNGKGLYVQFLQLKDDQNIAEQQSANQKCINDYFKRDKKLRLDEDNNRLRSNVIALLKLEKGLRKTGVCIGIQVSQNKVAGVYYANNQDAKIANMLIAAGLYNETERSMLLKKIDQAFAEKGTGTSKPYGALGCDLL